MINVILVLDLSVYGLFGRCRCRVRGGQHPARRASNLSIYSTVGMTGMEGDHIH